MFFLCNITDHVLYRQGLFWGGLVLALLVVWTGHRRLMRVLKVKATHATGALDDSVVQLISTPLLFLFVWIVFFSFARIQLIDHPLEQAFSKISTLLFIFATSWLAVKLVRAFSLFLQKGINLKESNNLRARKVMTQLVVFRAIADSIIVLVAVLLGLLSFDAAKNIGLSLLTSAGIIGVIVGFAAQKSLGMVLAGLQIAITQPIRLDDVVVVEGEWGRIEEITLTYVVVRIWDERRLILPITYFLEKPFQNWTRISADILGSVVLCVSYELPLAPLRAELDRLVAANPNWDQRVASIQVTDAMERYKEIRILVSSSDSSKNWDLRVALREQLIDFLQRTQPGAFVRARLELTQNEGIGRDRKEI